MTCFPVPSPSNAWATRLYGAYSIVGFSDDLKFVDKTIREYYGMDVPYKEGK